MCGRYAITLPPEAVRAFFHYVEQPNFPARYNIAPTQPTPIVRMQRGQAGKTRHFNLVRWGFLPGFVKDPKDFPLVINARSETVLDKPSFRNAMRRRRCIIIADAFYEWRRDKNVVGKTASVPFLIRRRDGNPMAFAGLWEAWMGPNGEELETACIVTTDANGVMAAIHDRMPVILEPQDFDTWLDNDDVEVEDAARLMRPAAEEVLEAFRISTAVNKVANDNPEIQQPATDQFAEAEEHPARKAAARKPPDDYGTLF
jgi:putative SOS response-associated peptidase YedK